MNQTLFWIWLQERLGAGAKTKYLLDAFGSVKAVYEATDYRGVCTPARAKDLLEKDTQKALAIYRYCQQKGYRLLTPDDAQYPDYLRNIADFPCVLYMCGELDLNREPLIAVVGARKATYYGLNVATRLSYSMAAGGVCVVSGGALGTDTAAHKGALLAGGKTLMVLGCGLDGGYLLENRDLLESVKKNGAVLSEFAPKVKANHFTFPIRNRLIAAMCLGTVVVQAGVKSGSLITAKFARQYGREVFGVPGGIYNKDFQGVNELIRDGASIVVGVGDILECFKNDFASKIDIRKALAYDIREKELIYEELPKVGIEAVDGEIELDLQVKKRVSGLSPKARLVYDSLETGEKHINEICALTSLSQSEVLAALTGLELMDAVTAVEGRKYRQC